MSASAIYEGWVSHRRHRPRRRAFRYRHLMYYLDLGEVEEAMSRHPFFGTSQRRPVRFARPDYLGDPGRPLEAEVRDLVERELGTRPLGPIRLLTQLRHLGRCFNPVSFYYCFEAAGGRERLEAVVAEVTNTPWGERHAYVAAAEEEGLKRHRFRKRLHVSPLLPVEQDYEMSTGVPGERLGVHIANLEHGERVHDATLALGRRPLNRRSMSSALVRYPPMSLAVPLRIYGQALRARLAGAEWHRHPARVGP